MDLASLYRGCDEYSFIPMVRQFYAEASGRVDAVMWEGDARILEMVLRERKTGTVVYYGTDPKQLQAIGGRFAASNDVLQLRLIRPVSGAPAGEGACASFFPQPYVTEVLREFGENAFHLAVAGTFLQADCLGMAQLVVTDGGLILQQDMDSYGAPLTENADDELRRLALSRFAEHQFFDLESVVAIRNRKSSPPYADAPLAAKRWAFLRDIFRSLAEADIRFVVLRNFDMIPNFCSLNKDIDLCIHPADFSRAHAILQAMPWRDETGGTMLYGAKRHRHYKREDLDLLLDVVQGLYYASPNNGEKMPVCSWLQNALFERRLFRDSWLLAYPHPHDLFILFACRGIYDKKTISKRYRMYLERLLRQVDREQIVKELELVFYAFAPELVRLVASGEAESLFRRYTQFAEY